MTRGLPSSSAKPRSRAVVARQMQRAIGSLTQSSLARMEREMPWFRDLSAEQRAWIGMILQAGYSTFISWYRHPTGPPPTLAVEVFGNAPRSFAGVITLQQTVAMIRLSIEVAEAELVGAVEPEDAPGVRESVLRYGRELAFASADVYAHAAEMRGAWDARLEALVVDSVMRGEADETVRTRASALGWHDSGQVVVVVGQAPDSSTAARESVVDEVRRVAQHASLDALGAVQGDRLVVVLGGVVDPDKAGAVIASLFGDGPVVVGPMVEDLITAHLSASAAVAAFRAARGWPAPSGPLGSDDLLAERALNGDALARRALVEEVYDPLLQAGGGVLETLVSFLDQGGSIEGTARVLFVHPNTVRYRLRRVADLTGLVPGNARQSFTLRVAVVLGRLGSGTTDPAPPL